MHPGPFSSLNLVSIPLRTRSQHLPLSKHHTRRGDQPGLICEVTQSPIGANSVDIVSHSGSNYDASFRLALTPEAVGFAICFDVY